MTAQTAQAAREQGNGIYAAMAGIIGELGAIRKDKRCQQGANFQYRGIDDIYNSLNPLMAKYGVFVLPMAGERTSESRQTRNGGSVEYVTVHMSYRFCSKDGSFVECSTIGEAMDAGDKATNKAMAIAHKYAILQTFCVPTEDLQYDDPDRMAYELAPRPQETKKPAGNSQAQKFEGMTTEQGEALSAYMMRQHGDRTAEYLEELSAFFGRKISSASRELSRSDVARFLEAVNKSNKGA